MKCEVEWGIRHDASQTAERVKRGSMVLDKKAALRLYEQLIASFDTLPQEVPVSLSWGTQRLSWEDGFRNYWVTITVL
jgi:hypothetical protein